MAIEDLRELDSDNRMVARCRDYLERSSCLRTGYSTHHFKCSI
jgi:hypothetical protein